LQLIAIALAFQFPSSLYASGLAGLQGQGRMNALQILGNNLGYGGGVVALLWRADIVWFFVVQVLVAAIQTLVTRRVTWVRVGGKHTAPGAFLFGLGSARVRI